MCVVSMVIGSKTAEWERRYPGNYEYRPNPFLPGPILPTQQEVDEFRRLLDRARQYDLDHNQPDCDTTEKKQKLLDLASELGVDIDFI